jgi:GNAT superfamily N-acetyltransferase
MSEHATQLRIGGTREVIRATLNDELALDDLFDAEALWASARIRMVQEFSRRGLSTVSWPQSLHWNWAQKAAELPSSRLGPFGDIRVLGIMCQNEWQGILLAKAAEYFTRTKKEGRELIYVEYLESAPWNWEEPRIEQQARFRGVGVQLVEAAIEWSMQLGFRGRVGLHALEQAEDFYRRRCRMTDLGPDWEYKAMRYFEFTEAQAQAFLESRT